MGVLLLLLQRAAEMMEIVGLKKCASTTYVKILVLCMELVGIMQFAKPLITREYVHVHLDTVEIHILYVLEVSLLIFVSTHF